MSDRIDSEPLNAPVEDRDNGARRKRAKCLIPLKELLARHPYLNGAWHVSDWVKSGRIHRHRNPEASSGLYDDNEVIDEILKERCVLPASDYPRFPEDGISWGAIEAATATWKCSEMLLRRLMKEHDVPQRYERIDGRARRSICFVAERVDADRTEKVASIAAIFEHRRLLPSAEPRDLKTIQELGDEEGITTEEAEQIGWNRVMLGKYSDGLKQTAGKRKVREGMRHPALTKVSPDGKIRSWARQARRKDAEGADFETVFWQPVWQIGDLRAIDKWEGPQTGGKVLVEEAVRKTGLARRTILKLVAAKMVDGVRKGRKKSGPKQDSWQDTWFVDLVGLVGTHAFRVRATRGKRVFEIGGKDFYPLVEWKNQFPKKLREKIREKIDSLYWVPKKYGGGGRGCRYLDGRTLTCTRVATEYRTAVGKGEKGKLLVFSGDDRRQITARLLGRPVEPAPTPQELRKMIDDMHAAARGDEIRKAINQDQPATNGDGTNQASIAALAPATAEPSMPLASDGGYSQVEAARLLDISKGRVKHLIDEGDLKTNGARGRKCRVLPDSITEYKKRQKAEKARMESIKRRQQATDRWANGL